MATELTIMGYGQAAHTQQKLTQVLPPPSPTRWVPRHYGQEHFTVVLEMIVNENEVKRFSLITFSCYFSHLDNDRS